LVLTALITRNSRVTRARLTCRRRFVLDLHARLVYHGILPMKMTMTTCAAIVALIAPAFAAGDAWTTDYAAAKEKAAGDGKDLFLEFTGSDWCPPCQMLNREVFSKDEFTSGAKEHFVLVKLDFPNDRSEQSDELQAQNKELSERYSVQGFPTVLLCDAKGRPYAATGYRPGGVENYIEHLEELRGRKATRDAAFEAAAAAEGVDKAKALVEALDAMDLDDQAVQHFYGEIVEQIKASDPDDASGFARKAEVRARIVAFEEKIGELAQNGDFDSVLTEVDEVLKTDGLTPDQTQQITLTRALVFAQQGKFDDAIKVVDEALLISPQSEIASHLDGFKAQLSAARDAAQDEDGASDEEP
jgi:thioredoxin-related protein